jgi:hypothetical protein
MNPKTATPRIPITSNASKPQMNTVKHRCFLTPVVQ